MHASALEAITALATAGGSLLTGLAALIWVLRHNHSGSDL